MEPWIALTITAAFLQNLRSVGQKALKSAMGTTGATFVRFGFGLPFAALAVLLLVKTGHGPLPGVPGDFLVWIVLGGLAQIAATALLVHLFSFRNFAVGTAYSRTEPAQAAIIALLLLGETTSMATLVAIGISVAGVVLISVARTPMTARNMLLTTFSRTSMIGIASGTLFALCSVSYRAASLSLGGPNALMQACWTLLWTVSFQTIVMLVWMAWRERAEFGRIARAWKGSLFTGFVGASCSICWFTAMTLQKTPLVKAVGQVELLFTFAATVFYFRERMNTREVCGCLLIVAGILALVLI